ncbi:uncharacterized protein LOC114528962 [Dendronephthya gigantea]|uniref:uncharacterized protein LOC114528962 n=1 Tax=Dendronephthya gigantea TaxID=151771 RepID=UPI00106B00CD|nr:uncharacterized protein LOC114528962 [Dendronephthya gigantea]
MNKIVGLRIPMMSISWIFAVILCFVALRVHGHGKIKVTTESKLGPCNERNFGELILVNYRKGKNTLLVCSKDEGKFGWSTTNDDGQTGEISNPGHDCMSILHANPEAEDGFYWITLNNRKPKKAWCDMKTDGGGYILIGRTNSSGIWAVPSNDDAVEPFGKPHWCSALGNTDVIDFRVQMTSEEDFQKTKAHWAYRFKTPRKLKNLMINKKGCSSHSPGIGNVKYVKNLESGHIVTTQFRCSKFGIGYHPYTNIGWTMINSCLEKPCPYGFAFHRDYPIQQDYSGSFSYSATKSISGIEYGATAQVGCSRGHCCGCHGPSRGKRNYCFEKCKAGNGGTIESHVYSWFWVRTSSHKKFWTKCIDYKMMENDTFVWYKLIGNSESPIEGRCDRTGKALLYDGMLVVPDNTTAEKTPLIDGMIVYRQDTEKIYVTKHEKLHPLADEEKVLETKEELNKSLEKNNKILRKFETLWKALNKSIVETKTQLAEVKSVLNVGRYSNPGKSCLDILQRAKTASLGNGEYWIKLDNKPLKVYCDMKADGGGWTLVTNLVLKNSRGMDWSL